MCIRDSTQTAGFGGEGTVAAIQHTGLQKYRLWIKNLSGNGMPFVQGSNAGFNGTITVVGTPNRLLGNIEQTAFTDSNMPGTIGNLLVFEHTAPINFSGTITEYFGRDIEYALKTSFYRISYVDRNGNPKNADRQGSFSPTACSKSPNIFYGDMAYDINDKSNPVTLKITTCDTSGNYFESTIIIE